MKASNGSVVLISGSAALDSKPGFAAVGAINAAITALVKAFAEKGIKDGAQVNSVVPGAVNVHGRPSKHLADRFLGCTLTAHCNEPFVSYLHDKRVYFTSRPRCLAVLLMCP